MYSMLIIWTQRLWFHTWIRDNFTIGEILPHFMSHLNAVNYSFGCVLDDVSGAVFEDQEDPLVLCWKLLFRLRQPRIKQLLH